MNDVIVQEVTLIEPPKVEEIKVPEREIAYTINDKYFKGFEVIKSANAFWMERQKVEDLIRCFKQGYNVGQACIFAGISRGQWNYFNEMHPTFSDVKTACEEVGKMIAESNIHGFLIDKDKIATMWYAERRIPEKYAKKDWSDSPGPVINNFGTIINSPPPRIGANTAALLKEEEALKENNG